MKTMSPEEYQLEFIYKLREIDQDVVLTPDQSRLLELKEEWETIKDEQELIGLEFLLENTTLPDEDIEKLRQQYLQIKSGIINLLDQKYKNFGLK